MITLVMFIFLLNPVINTGGNIACESNINRLKLCFSVTDLLIYRMSNVLFPLFKYVCQIEYKT